MGRGKLKYRDVVGGRKIKSSNQKKYGKQQKQRKPYSLHQSQGGGHGGKKQGPHKKRPRYEEQLDEPKRVKYEKPPEPESEVEEEEDTASKLMAMIDPDYKKSLQVQKMKREAAIESDFESSDDDEQDTNQEAAVGADESGDGQSDDDELVEDEIAETATEIDDVNNEHDPFVRHLFYNLHENLLEAAQAKRYETHVSTWPALGNVCTRLVKPSGEIPKAGTKILDKINKFAPVGTVPLQPSTPINLQKLFVKTQIRDHLRKANVVLEPGAKEVLTPLQSELFAVMNNYQDLMCTERTFDNAEEIRYAYCLHAVNHILKTRTKILHHNARLSDKNDVPEEFRDQGVVRPKILILLPFRDAAYRVIRMITEILLKEDKGNVIKKDRFIKEFTGDEIVFPRANPKPDDYVKTFSGNCSDDFRIGMTVTKKSLKLYADFYSSDIIVASTLGLRTIIGAEGEPHRDFDFLASIELLILDQAEIFLMQNFDHLSHIMKHVHLKPEKRHNTDFSRVRHWSINGWEKYYRQTLIFSSLPSPHLNRIFNRCCHNYAGKVVTNNPVATGAADRIAKDVRKHPQYFLKFQASSAAASTEERFDFFINDVLPELKEAKMKQTLIYVPVEFDLVKLRGYFNKEDLSFGQICDSTSEGKVAMARDKFFHGEVKFLLYSERFHFFKRIKIKGIRHLVFYQPPTFPHFYTEMCNLMQEENMNRKVGDSYMTIRVIYSKFDRIALDGIVSSDEADRMIESEKNLHCTHKI